MTPKYRNRRTGKYDSKKEAARAAELQILAKIGKIEDLVEQPEYVLIPKQQGERAVKYRGDFQYFDREQNKTVIEDCKGTRGGKDGWFDMAVRYWMPMPQAPTEEAERG